MSPFLAAVIAAAWLATPPAFFAWLRSWKPAHTRKLLGRGAVLVDLGTPDEYASEHLAGAVNVPYEALALRQDELGEHERPIVLYARSRLLGIEAAQTLRGIGFHEVFDAGTLADVESWEVRPPIEVRAQA
ncbi:MAG: rhodanese-like domain-containing protein [Polyangiaceae bacterium]